MAAQETTINGMTIDEFLASLNFEESLELIEKVLAQKARAERVFCAGTGDAGTARTSKETHTRQA